MLNTLAQVAAENPDPILPTGVGAGSVGLAWAAWAFFLKERLLGPTPKFTQAEWETVKSQAAKVPRLETHARNMHKALRQIRGHIESGEHAEAKAAIRMAESLSDSHFTADSIEP